MLFSINFKEIIFFKNILNIINLNFNIMIYLIVSIDFISFLLKFSEKLFIKLKIY